jgi:predicted ATPase
MKITRLQIDNFKGLQRIDFAIDKATNVIVGPNAVGKTTLLDAVRLVKGLLAPRYYQESQQVLISLGALSPNFQFLGNRSLDFSALANDPAREVSITISLQLSDHESTLVHGRAAQLALLLLRSRTGRTDEQGQFALTQLLSSDQGRRAFSDIQKEVNDKLVQLLDSKTLELSLHVNPATLSIAGTNDLAQNVVSLLEQLQPAHQALFTYFPADRAFPQGEVNIQFGSADAGNLIQSHIGNSALKYQRLKQTIIQAKIFGEKGPVQIENEFGRVLSGLLPGKALAGIQSNEMGLLKVLIQDQQSGKIFDIDSMSSGEKGVILTFLLIRNSLAPGGIILIDEPELHLNPAVCKSLLPFLVDECIDDGKAQAFICTHSAEILGSAFERDDCGLFHLRSGTDISRVYRQDTFEVFEALRRLGVSTADTLFSKGTIFVEGDHDVELLQAGFPDQVSGYKLANLGGRQRVEQDIRKLQDAGEHEVGKAQIFIFDLDNKPSDLVGNQRVRVLQWDRFCFENYLLDEDSMFDVLKEAARKPPDSRGSFSTELKDIALSQTTEMAVRTVYKRLEPENPGLRSTDLSTGILSEIAKVLAMRLESIAGQIRAFDLPTWVRDFEEEVKQAEQKIQEDWSRDWIRLCDGKRVIKDLYSRYSINIDKLSFKRRVIQQMREKPSETWRVVESRLRETLAP